MCANILQKRLCVVFCGTLLNHIFKFLHYCEDLLNVIVVYKARSHNLLSLCIEPICVWTWWSKLLNSCLKRIMRVSMTYLYYLHFLDWISRIRHQLLISKTKVLILKSNLYDGIVSIVQRKVVSCWLRFLLKNIHGEWKWCFFHLNLDCIFFPY